MYLEDYENGRICEVEFCELYNAKNTKTMVHNDLKDEVDFSVYYKGKLVQTTELKSDFHKSDNIFMETIANVRKNSCGGPDQAKQNYNATYFVVWFPLDTVDNCYIFNNDKLVEWLKENRDNYYCSTVKNIGYYSKGVIIPKSVLRALPFTQVQTFLSSRHNH